ncbi:hypothetical protein GYMLUDRAFT_830350 [Collybiopsis luxurians FD-317 M1]|uniref:Uncharacterized protein n=1 Tax=Collybiopsis luxurians FD-317 M1 TaxID=944289 RepID=A0A0D0CCW4_9AGAR|nr:hypothetical protein GYMLUDRAFT_830350 [Collybiopsis luxurians FD-317 M1]
MSLLTILSSPPDVPSDLDPPGNNTTPVALELARLVCFQLYRYEFEWCCFRFGKHHVHTEQHPHSPTHHPRPNHHLDHQCRRPKHRHCHHHRIRPISRIRHHLCCLPSQQQQRSQLIRIELDIKHRQDRRRCIGWGGRVGDHSCCAVFCVQEADEEERA